MKARNCSTIFQFRSSVLLLALLTAFSGAQATAAGGPSPGGRAQAQATLPAQSQAAPAQMAPQSASVCGSQPLCAETSDFAATITDFRTSTAGYYKLIDVVLRFQNKTSQPIILGYVDGSLEATDDQGNRYGMAGNGQGVRGLGIISGNNLDPKFVLQPGGAGDARFELAWRPANEIQGTTFELYLTIREATPVDARQYVLGGEFPFHCQGLANGVRAAISSTNASGAGLAGGAAPAGAGVTAAAGVASAVAGAAPGSAQPGCVPAGQGAQNAASTIANAASSVGGQNQKAAGAASQISSAASTISSLGSLFKSKKAATTSAQSTTGLPPCPPGSTGDASGVSTVASTVGGAVPQAAGGASSVAAVASSVTGASYSRRRRCITRCRGIRARRRWWESVCRPTALLQRRPVHGGDPVGGRKSKGLVGSDASQCDQPAHPLGLQRDYQSVKGQPRPRPIASAGP